MGMPEAQIILAQAAAYVACAPKSNAACDAIFEAMESVRTVKTTVPAHLQDAHYKGRPTLEGEPDINTPMTIRITMWNSSICRMRSGAPLSTGPRRMGMRLRSGRTSGKYIRTEQGGKEHE